MGPTQINGLPAHALLVDVVVVLVPLAALLVVLSALWPAARRRLGVLTPVIALVALVSVPLTTHAGEWLEHRVPPDELVRRHAELGDGLLPWAGGLFVLAAVAWLVARRTAATVDGGAAGTAAGGGGCDHGRRGGCDHAAWRAGGDDRARGAERRGRRRFGRADLPDRRQRREGRLARQLHSDPRERWLTGTASTASGPLAASGDEGASARVACWTSSSDSACRSASKAATPPRTPNSRLLATR